MALIDGFIGYGAALAYSTDGGNTYTNLAEITDLMPPEQDVTSVKRTGYDAAFAYHIFLAGLIDGGEASFKTMLFATRLNALLGLLRVNATWRLTFPDGTITSSTLVFPGFITKLGTPTPLDDKAEIDVKLKISGRPVFTLGS